VNLTTLRSRVAGTIGLDNTAASAEQVLVDGWVNEGRDQILVRARLRVERADLALTADTTAYELSASILDIIRVVLNGDWEHPLPRMGTDEILERESFTASTVVGYSLQGTNYLMVAGTPSTGDSLDMLYVPAVTDMSSGAHDPSSATYGGIPKLLHPAIEAYAKWKAADYDDDTSSQQGQVYRQEWQAWLVEARNYRIRMGGPLARKRARVGRLVVAQSPGVDTGAGWQ
jgi:hypothetical protein